MPTPLQTFAFRPNPSGYRLPLIESSIASGDNIPLTFREHLLRFESPFFRSSFLEVIGKYSAQPFYPQAYLKPSLFSLQQWIGHISLSGNTLAPMRKVFWTLGSLVVCGAIVGF